MAPATFTWFQIFRPTLSASATSATSSTVVIFRSRITNGASHTGFRLVRGA